MQYIKDIIERAFDLKPEHLGPEVHNAVDEVLQSLNKGKLRVAEKIDGKWEVNQWIKKAILLEFRMNPSRVSRAGEFVYFDKVPLKFTLYNERMFKEGGFRVVPGAIAREGSFIAPGAVLMPSYVNIGAYVGENTMVDTWATVGSCAQIGKNCHLSGGVGIGAFWNLSRPTQLLLKITASSVPAVKLSKASSLKKTPLSLWASLSAKARRSMTEQQAKFSEAVFLPVPLLSREASRAKTANIT